MNGVLVKFTWPNGKSDQPETGALPQNILIKFHDPRVGRINRVYLNESDEDNGQYVEAVPIESKSNVGTYSIATHSLLGTCHR